MTHTRFLGPLKQAIQQNTRTLPHLTPKSLFWAQPSLKYTPSFFSQLSRTFNTATNENLNNMRVRIRAPITQTLDEDKEDLQIVVDAITAASTKLHADNFPIDIIEHEVLTNTIQQENLINTSSSYF